MLSINSSVYKQSNMFTMNSSIKLDRTDLASNTIISLDSIAHHIGINFHNIEWTAVSTKGGVANK